MKLNFIFYYLLLISGYLLMPQTAFAQQNVQKYYPDYASFSPEAAGMLKALQYPVGENTGVPSISIPLYEMKSRSISLPLTLNYHAGSFKAREVAGVTGLGWNLSANLQIVREVCGADDFKKSGINDYSGYYYNKYGITDEFYPDASLTDTRHLYEILAGNIDSQPDRFYYNILGKSGSFVLSKTRNERIFLPIPYNGISITCIPVSDNSSSVQFKITDTDGTEYYFTLAEVTSDPVYYSTAYENAWKCTSIVAPDRTDTIHLDYKKLASLYSKAEEDYAEVYENQNGVQGQPWLDYGGTIYADEVKGKAGNSYEEVMKRFAFFNLSVPRTIMHSSGPDAGLIMYTQYNDEYGWHHDDLFYEGFRPFSWKATLQTRYAISRISASNQELNFYYDSHRCLQSIELADADGHKIRNFYFDQSTVGSYESEKRTNLTNYLNRVRIVEAAGTKKTLSYSFEYYSQHAFGNYTKGGNYWGGLNSRTHDMYSSTYTSIPPFYITTRYYRSNDYRDYKDDFFFYLGGDGQGNVLQWDEPELEYSRAGQLNKITYPTGGYTEFDFGMHYGYWTEPYWLSFEAGGLRINEIRNFNADNSLQNKKVYKYGEVGAGIPNGFLFYSFDTTLYPFFYKQDVEYIVNPSFGNSTFNCTARGIMETKTTYLSSFMEGMNFNTGAPVYYEKVTEYDYNASGENGKKEFIYTAPDAFGYFTHRKLGNTNVLRFDEDWRRGRLEHENTYRSLGNKQYSLIHSVDYEYDYNEASRTSYTAAPFQRRIFMGVYTSDYNRYNHSELASPDKMNLIGNGVDLYSNMISTGAVYPVKKTETSYDGGKDSATVYRYSYNSYFQPTETTITYPDGHQERETISYSTLRNMVGVPTEIKHSTNTYGTTWQNVDGMLRNFREDNPAQVEKIYALAPGSGYYLKAKFGYDTQDNMVSSTMSDTPDVVYLWGYDNQYPIAEIRNSDYTTVCTALGENVVTALQNSSDPDYIRLRVAELRTHALMKEAQVKTFIHSPLIGVSEITEADGLTTKYNYDYLGHLKGITDPTGFEASYYDYHYTH